MSTNRKEQVYDYLREAIMSNTLKPGKPLREMEIANEMQMSRTPVREAFRELEAEGLITNFPACGTIVSNITPSDVEEIYELRVLYEIWALGKSINRITEKELDAVEQDFINSKKHDDTDLWHKADRQLHRLIIEKSGNRRFIAHVNQLNVQIERIRLLSAMDEKRRESSYTEHLKIIRLIRRRDLPKCTAALQQHLQEVADSAIEAVRIANFE